MVYRQPLTIMDNATRQPVKNPLTLKSIQNITAKYGLVTPAEAGQTIKQTVERMGAAFDVTKGEDKAPVFEYGNEGMILRKKVITFKAISSIGHDFHRSKLIDAYKLEQAGDAQGAHVLYQEYLDGARFSASVLSTEQPFNFDLTNGDEVKLKVEIWDDKIIRGTGKTIKLMAPKEVAAFNGAAFFASITAVADPEANKPEGAEADPTKAKVDASVEE